MVYCYEMIYPDPDSIIHQKSAIIGPIPPFAVSQNPMACKHKHERRIQTVSFAAQNLP